MSDKHAREAALYIFSTSDKTWPAVLRATPIIQRAIAAAVAEERDALRAVVEAARAFRNQFRPQDLGPLRAALAKLEESS